MVKQKSDSYHCDQKADSGQALRDAAFIVWNSRTVFTTTYKYESSINAQSFVVLCVVSFLTTRQRWPQHPIRILRQFRMFNYIDFSQHSNKQTTIVFTVYSDTFRLTRVIFRLELICLQGHCAYSGIPDACMFFT